MRRFLLIVLHTFVITACQTTTHSTVEAFRDLSTRRVTVNSGDGTPLNAYLYRSELKQPGPAVIMMHGCSGLLTKRGALKTHQASWRDIMLAEGYSVLLLDSFSPRGHRTICRVRNRPILPERERPHDAYGALQWLQSQQFIDPRRIALMGWSNGAMAMLWAIGDNARQRPKYLQNDFATAVGFYPGCIKIGRTDFMAKVPTLLQVGLDDNWTWPKPCITLVKTSNHRGGAAMEIDAYEGAVHAFDNSKSKRRTITTRNSVYRSGEKSVSVGYHREAHQKAIMRVRSYLRAMLGP
jgi:dienelactone hydrolase